MIRAVLLALVSAASVAAPGAAAARLLDKIVVVVDDKPHTLSAVRRVLGNYGARKQIAPMIYAKSARAGAGHVVDIVVNRHVVKSHLASIGYVIADDQVDRHIRETETRLGLSRQRFLDFLGENGMTFEEYFEIIRETIEFNVFQERVIAPLISVTDQDLKNEYYRTNRDGSTLSFDLRLVDYSVDEGWVEPGGGPAAFRAAVESHRNTGNVPERFSSLEVRDLGSIKEDGLIPAVRAAVRDVPEGGFSEPVSMGGARHVFFVQKRDMVESEDFLRAREGIRAALFAKNAERTRAMWLEREVAKHYVRRSL